MARSDRVGTLAYAAVSPDEERLAIGTLRDSLIAGQRAETYNRTWVLSKPHDVDNERVHGHIGIVTEMDAWDDIANEFRHGSIEAGYATPYLLDHSNGSMVFQAQGSTIKPQSFVNAFEHLLNAGSAGTWKVRLAEREMPWEEFLSRIQRLEYLSVRLDTPNPRFRTELAEHLVQGADAASTTVTMRSDEAGSIDSDADVVEELMRHAEDYGETTARGITEREERIRWKSRRRRAQVTTKAPADPESGEVSLDELWQAGRRWNDIPFFPEE